MLKRQVSTNGQREAKAVLNIPWAATGGQGLNWLPRTDRIGKDSHMVEWKQFFVIRHEQNTTAHPDIIQSQSECIQSKRSSKLAHRFWHLGRQTLFDSEGFVEI